MSDLQTDWLQTKPPTREPVPPSLGEVLRKRTILDAITYAQECAALEEKQVYGPLGWSKEVWSRIFNPDTKQPVFFDARRLLPFMQLTNDAPLMWLAHQRGYDWSTIRTYQSDTQRELEQVRAELDALKRERAVEVRLMRELQR